MKEDYISDDEVIRSVNWIDSKGFYLVLHKILMFISVSSLENDALAWMRGLDRLASFTRVFWKKQKDFIKYEEIYANFLRHHNNSTKIINNSVRQNLLNKEYEYLRQAERLIFDNIGHLFLKIDDDDLDDEDDWMTAHLRPGEDNS
jgi:hypothetical protein